MFDGTHASSMTPNTLSFPMTSSINPLRAARTPANGDDSRMQTTTRPRLTSEWAMARPSLSAFSSASRQTYTVCSPTAGTGSSAYVIKQLPITGKIGELRDLALARVPYHDVGRRATGQRRRRALAQDRLAEIPEAADHHLHRTVAGHGVIGFVEQPAGRDVLDGEEVQPQPRVPADPDAAGAQRDAKLASRTCA